MWFWSVGSSDRSLEWASSDKLFSDRGLLVQVFPGSYSQPAMAPAT
ncbi:MAG TPA: hypothetical protein V6D12_20750 [Candidatus Obscuribacterales bacterium]